MMRGPAICVLVAVVVCAFAKPIEYAYEANGIGYYIMYQSQPWNRAKEICVESGGKLAVPKSEAEFKFIQSLVRGMYYPNITGTDFKLLVWLGINNLDNYKVWKNVDGENIEDTGYHTWTGEYNGRGYSDSPAEPHCVGIDAVNPGLRDWWCHRAQPYICQFATNSDSTTATTTTTTTASSI